MGDRNYSFLPRLSIHRPVSVVMGLLTLLVLGVIANYKIPIELIPSGLENKRLFIRVSYKDTTPMDSLDKLVKPIEDILGTVTGVDRVISTSHGGGGNLQVRFHEGIDMKEAYTDVKDRMDRVLLDMPEEVERIQVFKWDSDDEPIMFAAMSLDANFVDPEFFIERHIQPALQRIEGVGNVEVHGLNKKELRIDFDQERLNSHNVNVFKLSNSLKNENFNLGAGRIEEGNQDFLVRSVGRFENLQELGDLEVDRETKLKLKDLGSVAMRSPERWGIWRLRGAKAYGIEIKRASGANIVAISQEVNQVLDEFENSDRWGAVDVHVFWDQGKFIMQSVDNLKMSATWGGLFSIVVLFAFLRSANITITIALAIPLSLMTSVVVLYFTGWTMNLLTMMGLLLSVGLVVDNAIVMVENIHRKREIGLGPEKAALEGASEVGLAITMATLTTIVVFLPLILMGNDGVMRFFLLRIGVPVMSSLIASLLIALLLIPLATKIFAEKLSETKVEVPVGCLNRFYQKILKASLTDRTQAVFVLALVIAGTGVVASKLDREDNSSAQRQIRVRFDMPAGLSKPEIFGIVEDAENFVESQKLEYDYDTFSSFHDGNVAQLIINLKTDTLPWYEVGYRGIVDRLGLLENKPMTRTEIVDDLVARMPIPPGTKLRLKRSNEEDPTKTSNVTLYGDDTDTLYRISEEVERRLRSIEALIAIESDVETNEQELNIVLDRVQAMKMGVDVNEVSRAISYSIRGSNIGRFFTEDGRDIVIRAGLEKEDKETVSDLRRLSFESDSGAIVPIESVSKFQYKSASKWIRREDRKTRLRIDALMTKQGSSRVDEQIHQVMESVDLPPGYRWDMGGRNRRLQNENDDIKFALLMIVIFVLFLMGVLFESFILPIAVLLTMILAAIGVVWILFVTGTPFDMMAGIGSMILCGVVVNNGIVLIDLSRRLMSEGLSRNQALIEASKRRFRPIWITSLTTIFGMVPMAVGGAKMIDVSYAPMGRVIVGGLIVSTFLTLIVVPIFYSLLDDLRAWVGSCFKAFFYNRPKENPAQSSRPN